MATDLGAFLEAFNPMDFIKGYEQSEKFATAQDLAKAQARTQAAAADIGEVKAAEFRAPQFAETRRVQDQETQFKSLLGGDLARISRAATLSREPQLQGSMAADIDTQFARSEENRRRAEFSLAEELPEKIEERRGIIRQDRETREARLAHRDEQRKLAVAETAEKMWGAVGKQLAHDVEMGVVSALRQNPQMAEYDALEAMKAGADDRKLTIIKAYQQDAARRDLIRQTTNPVNNPNLDIALKRVDPALSSAGIDEKTGALRIVRTVTKDDGTTETVAAGLMSLTPDGVNDFVIRMSGQLPQTRTTAARTTTGGKAPAENVKQSGSDRSGAAPPATEQPPAGKKTPPPPTPKRDAGQIINNYATELNQLGANVPAGASPSEVATSVADLQKKLNKIHANLREELYGPNGVMAKARGGEADPRARSLMDEMNNVSKQMRRLAEMRNTIDDVAAAVRKQQQPGARSIAELLGVQPKPGAQTDYGPL